MTTILASWELGRAFGHVATVAPLARGLARRGILTAFAARDLVTAAGVSDRPFARILQAPLHQRPTPRIPTRTYAEAIADGGMGDADHATVLVAAWLQLFDGVRPAGLVAEFAPGSLLAAHVAGLPAVRAGSSWVAPPASRPLPSLMPWLPDDPGDRVAAEVNADAVVRAVCRRFGAPVLDGLPALLANAPRHLATWPELDHNGVAEGATYYGAMTGLGATAAPDWPELPGPRVFVYLPADHPGAPALVAALSALAWPVVWHATAAPPPGGANIHYSPQPVDTARTLGEAAVWAGHGGHSTSCEAVRRGCPTLSLPNSLETALLGWRLQQRGLARTLSGNPDADTIRAALEELATAPRVRAAAAAAAARYTTYDPIAAEDAFARDIAVALGCP